MDKKMPKFKEPMGRNPFKAMEWTDRERPGFPSAGYQEAVEDAPQNAAVIMPEEEQTSEEAYAARPPVSVNGISHIEETSEKTREEISTTHPAPEVPASAPEHEQYVVFTLAEIQYAVPITNVTEIERPPQITAVPNVPNWVLGMANLRGEIISMVDLRGFLGMKRIGFGQATRMLVVRAREEEMAAGLIVDRVNGIRYLSADQINRSAEPVQDHMAPYLRGVYNHNSRLLMVLDFDNLLLSREMRQFEQT